MTLHCPKGGEYREREDMNQSPDGTYACKRCQPPEEA